MRGLVRKLAILALLGAAVGPALAADVIVAEQPPYCADHQSIALLVDNDVVSLKQEVARLMDEAIAVSNDQRWIYSSRPVFVWANEAKYSCGKAYGYLKASYRDEQNLNNCGCAYSRMQSYMH
ncbi:hypothetical protein SAZ10_33245 [Mesorhizobium sp. BAC0120]|uniref:hypothetical protein n=1 Tax=Mesorhizobium sp. BAC0120 TaxID=3090670 RepID=UPI00298C0D64|nr:hypothetical protein [Mesorhizobium sp. BAC0120]MDW6026637.1 hypothetical protein [Mesorhizobium sp. BAC0120]